MNRSENFVELMSVGNVSYQVDVDMHRRSEFIDCYFSNNHPNYPKSCVICRKNLSEKCLDCNANGGFINQDYFEKIVTRQINLFKIVYQTAEFESTYLSWLPKDLLIMINDMAVIETDIIINCSIVVGECKHLYHKHCIDKWIKKRDCCPLDNDKWKIDIMDSFQKVKISKLK